MLRGIFKEKQSSGGDLTADIMVQHFVESTGKTFGVPVGPRTQKIYRKHAVAFLKEMHMYYDEDI